MTTLPSPRCHVLSPTAAGKEEMEKQARPRQGRGDRTRGSMGSSINPANLWPEPWPGAPNCSRSRSRTQGMDAGVQITPSSHGRKRSSMEEDGGTGDRCAPQRQDGWPG